MGITTTTTSALYFLRAGLPIGLTGQLVWRECGWDARCVIVVCGVGVALRCG